MLRAFLCALVVLALISSPAWAAKKKKEPDDKPVTGKVTKVDISANTIYLAGGGDGGKKAAKADETDRSFKLPDGAKVIGADGSTLKEGLKSSELAVGAKVTIIKNSSGAVTEVHVSKPKDE